MTFVVVAQLEKCAREMSMKRIDVGFKLFKHLCREEIIDEHCPYEIDSILPDQDIDTYKFLDGCIERGCRGITCEECWEITVMGV